jgi:hypothetical protein
MRGNKRRDGEGIRKEIKIMMRSAVEVNVRCSYKVGRYFQRTRTQVAVEVRQRRKTSLIDVQ